MCLLGRRFQFAYKYGDYCRGFDDGRNGRIYVNVAIEKQNFISLSQKIIKHLIKIILSL